MRLSGVGEKRPRDMQPPFYFIPGLTLSKHPFEQRKGLFMMKLRGINTCKSLHPTKFEGYTIKERFEKMGWENLLSFNCDKVYTRIVEQWMASLSRTEDELTGIVDGKPYTITPGIVREILGVDIRTDLPYIRFKEVDFEAGTAENNIRWTEACKTVFGREENGEIRAKEGYEISMMTPLAKVLWRIAQSTFLSRGSDFLYSGSLYAPEIHLLHALLTGDYLYSFAHLMIDDIWDMYELKHRHYIPYGNYISEILCRLGAVSEDENVKVIPPMFRVMSKYSLSMLIFSESPTEYIIEDREMEERVTFPKEGTGEAPPQPLLTNVLSHQHMPPQMPVEMRNLFTKFQKQYDEMKTMATNIQKQMERQALEVERREQEREMLAAETEKLAKEREKMAEEREKHAQILAHAIIWDVERQRYFYEMEQEQLRMAWCQLNGGNAAGECQLPQVSHTSLHPPKEGSPYYDPTQGDEIPKVFQPLFQDIYGPTCKKPSSP